jgi:hypothetical protein
MTKTRIYNTGAYGIPRHLVTAAIDYYKKALYGRHMAYSGHAVRAYAEDRYRPGSGITMPKLWPQKVELVELETHDGTAPSKLIMRLGLTATFDLVVVLSLETGIIKTVWINERHDTHPTLNLSRYDRP